MGFFSGIANIGSKILGGTKHAAQWVAPTLHKVLSTISGPVGMIHPGIGGTLVYAANNQIVDGYAADYALKIAPDANSDFAFSAESGTVWKYETDWCNSGDVVPDQVTPASDVIPSDSIVNGSAGTSNEYARGDHQHPLQISTVLPAKDTANGEAGVATTYARSDRTHHANLSNDIPLKDTGTGTAGTSNVYSSITHQHPINVDPTTANVPLVNATAAANGTSDFYSRNNHVHPQQLTYDGNITATKFIKTGGLPTEILCANGDTTNKNGIKSQSFPQDVGATAKYIKLCRFEANNSYGDINVEFKFYSIRNFNDLKLHVTYDTTGLRAIIYDYLQQEANISFRLPTMLYYRTGLSKYGELWMTFGNYQGFEGRIDLLSQTMYGSPVVSDMLTNQLVATLPTDFTTKEDLMPNLQYNTETINNAPFLQNGNVHIYPNSAPFADGLRITRCEDSNGGCSVILGCDKTQTTGAVDHQWQIYSPASSNIFPFGLAVSLSSDYNNVNRGLRISADGNTLTSNGSVIAGTGATNGVIMSQTQPAAGSVNYSAGNPIL
ncbi:MAG: hypothetical protein EZS28_006953 [Streblomastix strix]|uniref:Uncharacterized protein n=1 Tax=Streblomastix strix TaxID=222440 RepID=A0A5J4WR05_9EUKA|nr:MAG: hypothetical protein EZS28_006953 [Streblomastix strix]